MRGYLYSLHLFIPLQDIVSASLYSIMEPEHQYGYIANVCVTRLARRKGIASSLLDVAIKAAKCWSKFFPSYFHVQISSHVKFPGCNTVNCLQILRICMFMLILVMLQPNSCIKKLGFRSVFLMS